MKGYALVADDNADLLAAVTAVLQDAGVTVRCATSGAEVVELLTQERQFDVVVTDISMPWISGLHVIRKARAVGMSTPFIIMTALQDRNLQVKLSELGEDVWQLRRKPFQFEELLTTVAAALARHPHGASAQMNTQSST